MANGSRLDQLLSFTATKHSRLNMKEFYASSVEVVNSSLCVTRAELATVGDPLVSSITPTSNRRSFVPQAIRSFLRQDYPNLEFVIVDDGVDSVRGCVPEHERVRYIRLDRAKRRDYRLMRLSNPGVFVYVRHGRNARGEFAPGRFINPSGWQRIEQPLIFPENALASYKSAASANESLHR